MLPSEDIDGFLAHYGKKGMKWGVRKDGDITSTTTKNSHLRRKSKDVTVKQKPGQFVTAKGGKRQTASTDAVKVAASRQYAKKSTTDALTTKQMQEAVTRMNLELQYAKVVKKVDRKSRNRKMVDAVLSSWGSVAVTLL